MKQNVLFSTLPPVATKVSLPSEGNQKMSEDQLRFLSEDVNNRIYNSDCILLATISKSAVVSMDLKYEFVIVYILTILCEIIYVFNGLRFFFFKKQTILTFQIH